MQLSAKNGNLNKGTHHWGLDFNSNRANVRHDILNPFALNLVTTATHTKNGRSSDATAAPPDSLSKSAFISYQGTFIQFLVTFFSTWQDETLCNTATRGELDTGDSIAAQI